MSEKQSISEQDVRHVAKLGRLNLTDEEIERIGGKLSSVLGYISKMNELNVDDVEPMAHAADITNVYRDDEPTEGISVDDALLNAPEKSPPYFKVPKVLGDGSSA